MEDRAFDHQGLEVLTTDECWELLRQAPVGRIGFMESGHPTIFPVNHALLGHRVVIRTAGGALLHQALMDQSIAFEVDGFDAEHRTGWSVLVQGMVGLLPADIDVDELHLDAWADSIARDRAVMLMPEEINGRRIILREP